MKRLYNQYSACPYDLSSAGKIYDIAQKAAEDVWKEVEKEDLDPRDAESICHSTLATVFAENILRKAIKMRKEERANDTKGI